MTERRPVAEVARSLRIESDEIRLYGDDVAKLSPSIAAGSRRREDDAKLVLVSSITPTPHGEGKTTTGIGLAQGLARIGRSACLALRQPSLGPVFGKKGGATGGGASALHPTDRINLHFTGDFHAITSAHNLLAAMLDNHLHFGSTPRIDPRRVLWPRVLDVNDRSLRHVMVGLGGRSQGVPRESRFEITAASEVMAALCLAEDTEDLRARLGRLLVAIGEDGSPITASALRATGAMCALLADALWPNLVQTTEGVPALVHGGPFANIAHGCNSVLATKTALRLADWVVTEAGFGFDLGAEKFFDIKCRSAGLDADVVVLVVTVRALRHHGGAAIDESSRADPVAVERGLPNLARHVESARAFGKTPLIALNRFGNDDADEIDVVARYCRHAGLTFAISDHFANGGPGSVALAEAVVAAGEVESTPRPFLYDLDDRPEDKIVAVARTMYGARGVTWTKRAEDDLAEVHRLGLHQLPVCIAKTQGSLSDDPQRRGRPEDFDITVSSIQANAGAGFLVVLTGDLLRMPGLPRRPNAEHIDVRDGEILGVG